MKRKFLILAFLFVFFSCDSETELPIRHIKMNTFRAKDNVRVSPIELIIDRLNRRDSSYVTTVFYDNYNIKKPYLITIPNLEKGLYLFSVSHQDEVYLIDDFKIVEVSPANEIELNFYLEPGKIDNEYYHE